MCSPPHLPYTCWPSALTTLWLPIPTDQDAILLPAPAHHSKPQRKPIGKPSPISPSSELMASCVPLLALSAQDHINSTRLWAPEAKKSILLPMTEFHCLQQAIWHIPWCTVFTGQPSLSLSEMWWAPSWPLPVPFHGTEFHKVIINNNKNAYGWAHTLRWTLLYLSSHSILTTITKWVIFMNCLA